MAERDRETYAKPVNGEYHVWFMDNLWKKSGEFEIEVREVEVIAALDEVCWYTDDMKPTVRSVANHFRRLQNVDMSYPIILGPDEELLDGAHRLAKAYLERRKYIKCVKLQKLPAPDAILKKLPRPLHNNQSRNDRNPCSQETFRKFDFLTDRIFPDQCVKY